MKRNTAFCACALALVFSWGCSEDGSSSSDDEPTWYRDVLPIAQKRCLSCHTGGGVGSFSMDTDPNDAASYEQVARVARYMLDAVEGGHMPPWDPDPACRSYREERILDAEEIDIFRRWSEQGAARGDPKHAPAPLDPAVLPRVDTTLRVEASYLPASPNGIDVQCFALDPALSSETDVVGLRVLPGSQRAHDALVYVLDRQSAQALDDADSASGFDCFGAPEAARLVGSWLPGARPVIYPDSTGVRLGPENVLIVQIYYDLASGDPAEDRSGIELMFAAAPVEHPASLSMLRNDEFSLPPMSRDNVAGATAVLPAAGAVLGVAAQLGLRGTSARLSLRGAECLLDIPRYNFGWQELYFLSDAAGLPIAAGDTVELTCTWNNSSTAAIAAGSTAADEMCVAHLFTTAQ